MTIHQSMSKSTKKHVLIVTHNRQGNIKGGGIETYQEIVGTAPEIETSFIWPLAHNGNYYLVFQHHSGEIIKHKIARKNFGSCAIDPIREKLFLNLLQRYNFDLVHFQHLHSWPLSLVKVAKQARIPTVYSLHDFYLVCEEYTLVGHDGRFCNTFDEPISQCDICLKGLPQRRGSGFQAKRRRRVREVIPYLDAIIANTQYSRDAFLKIYPETSPDRLHVLEMLTPFQRRRTKPLARKPSSDPLKVVVPSLFSTFKGADNVLRLIEGMADDNVQFTVLGRIQGQARQQRTQQIRSNKVTFLQGYSPDEAVKLMSNHHVSLHLSIWPETYMIALSEAWQAGVVPIVSELGAPGERVTDGVNGYSVGPHQLGRVKDRLLELSSNSDQLLAMQKAALSTPVVSPDDHLKQLYGLYDQLCSQHISR